jgi:hypothetical protein
MKALQSVYPEHKWTDLKVTHGYWKDGQNQRLFFDKLAPKLGVHRPEDWAKVTTKSVIEEGGSFVTNYYNGSLIKGSTLN